MDQMQSSYLNLMQAVTAQKATNESGKTADKDEFRKMLEQCGQEEKLVEEATPKQEAPDQVSDRDVEEPEAPQVVIDLPLCPEDEEENILLLQELAAMQVMVAEQRIVTEPEVENAVVQTAVDPATVENTPAVQANPAEQTEPELPVTEEVDSQPVQAVEQQTPTSEQGGEAGLQEQLADTVKTHEGAEYDLTETAETADGAETPIFNALETVPVKVSETRAPAEAAQAEPVENQIVSKLTETVSAGGTKVELQLTPENLGKVTIELTQKEDGSLHIALQAESSQTRELLERGMSGLQSLLSQTTRQEVEVNVAQPQEQQQQQNYDGHQEQKQQQQQRDNPKSSEDFLNQLRLGLLNSETEIL